ncbi:MAG: NADH-quinone oxidoreductase subunit L [Candidatus Omnitrophica bacterium CG11_big_fil_rev_8_21_14_0_20_45_26]|uniref:NADH-quinone oxidoreductase subunit L n=1 Tax=Candidatus Abzuiibacterium crystallinum TaxID=1974748 RepID=A0A2H0LM57_9BACT|nr:MAG: NADH-quinone oxidoreductase subunit L [Candidatus Omnitrophica bacterium CG11_big_fil_rev_8_21_14_0_20_45_26]PIW63703.1 MAG: NADH-quinone oxidoreductase subunit L [Candidatus Omnitrophica bacterium CG12_big_fil_rev_8_21_14_0_65_45_16]
MTEWLILFLPFFAAVIIALGTQRYAKLSAAVALTSIIASLILTCRLGLPELFEGHFSTIEKSLSWITLPGLSFEFGLLINTLSFAMLLIVLVVALCIFYYSVEYMEGEKGFARYFAYLAFFTFSMLGIVLSNNFLQLFIFWELVGVSSYLLIGFWYEKHSAADAGKKAFLTNRIGDYGFILGIILLWTLSSTWQVETLNFLHLANYLAGAHSHSHETLLTVISLLIFCGVIGKSAQFPLHVWLPDAMEGPTPVSALIHAATMVAAGVYLLARVFFLFHQSPLALEMIAYLGGFTAIFAATQALVQTDLKRVLAYSTLSQLGYMVLAIGLGSAGIAMFHLTTHAFFKALLFLGAGSVIHMTHEQDMTRLGNLSQRMPITTGLFIVGALALSGFFPFSGFWSKDEILVLALHQNSWLYVIAMLTAFLTAVYITRAVILTFFGSSQAEHGHEPKQWMLIPMILLAILSLVSGFRVPEIMHQSLDHPVHWNWQVAIVSTLMTLCGIALSVWLYQFQPQIVVKIRGKFSGIYQILNRRYYMDDFYDWVIQKIQAPFSRTCSAFESHVVVQGLVNSTARLTGACGHWLRKMQTGRLQNYVTVFFAGVVLIIYCLMARVIS